MFCAIPFHEFADILVELLLVAFIIHVNKIDDDNASNITQSKLVNQLVSCQHIKLERILLLVLINLFAAGIDINGEQCFGFIYNEITSVFKTDRSTETRFHLSGDVEMVKNRLRILVEFDDLGAFRSDEFQIMTHIIIDVLVIDLNRSKVRT